MVYHYKTPIRKDNMAYIGSCIYCNGSVTNASYHQQCRMEHLESLLERIQAHVIRAPKAPLPAEISSIITREGFRSKEQFEEEKRATEHNEIEKHLWQSGLNDHLQKARIDYEKRFPDPNPVTFG